MLNSMIVGFFSYFRFFYQDSWLLLGTDTFILLALTYVLTRKENKVTFESLGVNIKVYEKKIASWEPVPLAPKSTYKDSQIRVIKMYEGKIVITTGKQGENAQSITCINLAVPNPFGYVGDKEIVEVASQTISKCGVGSCGPRGFYGTNEYHLELEESIAKFLEVEDVILYSYALSAISTALPAYMKITDVVFCDEACDFGIKLGLMASKAQIVWYKHCDMDDLELNIEAVFAKEKKNMKKFSITKFFIVSESIFINTGNMVDLGKLLFFKKKYHIRIFLDETLTFGYLGMNGRGLSEHLNHSIKEIDMIYVSLEVAFGAVGAFFAGSKYVIDYQRLSALGFVFSASQPAFYAKTSLCILNRIKKDPSFLASLAGVTERFYNEISSVVGEKFEFIGKPPSYVYHLRYSSNYAKNMTYDEEYKQMKQIEKELLESKIAVVVSECLRNKEPRFQRPSIRFTLTSFLTDEEISSIKYAIS